MAWDKRTTTGLGAAAAITLVAGIGFSTGRDGGGSVPAPGDAPPAPASVEITAGGNLPAPDGPPPPVASPDAAPQPSPAAPATGKIVVHVTGAVKRPGVYTLKSGDRIYHAVRAAGGLKPNAQADAINQADFVRDGDQLYFATRDEFAKKQKPAATASGAAPRRPLVIRSAPPPDFGPFTRPSARQPVPVVTPAPPVRPVVVSAPVPIAAAVSPPPGRVLGKDPLPAAAQPPEPGADEDAEAAPGDGDAVPGDGAPAAPARGSRGGGKTGGSGSAKFKNPGDGTVNINTADAAELQRLPGVGPAMSARILEYRQQIGRFADASQLQDVKGIGAKTFAKMRPFLTVN